MGKEEFQFYEEVEHFRTPGDFSMGGLRILDNLFNFSFH